MNGPVPEVTPRPRRGGELATVAGTFLAYGALFFDRLAPLYLVALIAADLGAPSAAEGTLALLVGLGWAAAMPVVRATSGRFGDRNRIVVVAAVVAAAALGVWSSASGSWLPFVALRGLAGLASATGAPAATSIVFAVAPASRRGLDLGLVQAATRVIGSRVAPVVVTAVAVAAGWRTAMVVSALLLLAGAVALLVAVSDRSAVQTARCADPDPYRLHPGGRRNVLLSTLACVLLLAWLTVWSRSSVALVQDWLEVDADAAGRLVGTFGIGASIAAVMVPILSDRVGRRRALALSSGLGGRIGRHRPGPAGTDRRWRGGRRGAVARARRRRRRPPRAGHRRRDRGRRRRHDRRRRRRDAAAATRAGRVSVRRSRR